MIFQLRARSSVRQHPKLRKATTIDCGARHAFCKRHERLFGITAGQRTRRRRYSDIAFSPLTGFGGGSQNGGYASSITASSWARLMTIEPKHLRYIDQQDDLRSLNPFERERRGPLPSFKVVTLCDLTILHT
jgi:hypothetical protein